MKRRRIRVDVVSSSESCADAWIEKEVVALREDVQTQKKALMEDGCPKVWVVTFDHIQQHAAHGAVCVLIIPMEPSFGAAMHWFLRLKHHKRSLRGCFRNTGRRGGKLTHRYYGGLNPRPLGSTPKAWANPTNTPLGVVFGAMISSPIVGTMYLCKSFEFG